ncbi:MAG: sigma 54-interacting transcriptional regulator [Deltaproteobacteria bacterium]|nr:sigma 54-interacting transcriptional regulator [Deltaproteobacteria bacterium]
MAGPRILIVEDDLVVANSIIRSIEDLGYDIVGTTLSGEEAVQLAERKRPDLVLMDIGLEGEMDGIEAARSIRSRFGAAIVYLTGRKEDELFERAKSTEPYAYLSKPVAVHDLCHAVEMALYKRKMEAELRNAYNALERRVEERTKELSQLTVELMQEIDDRQRTEAALIESEARLRAVIDTAKDWIFVKDTALRYTMVNPRMEEMLSRSATETIGRTDEELFGQDAGKHSRSVDKRVLQGETVEEEHVKIIEGNPFTFLEVKTPLRNARGEVTGICGISHNITGRKLPYPLGVTLQSHYPSPAMRATLDETQRAARSDVTVLLTGESGSGKDYLARYIHEQSGRSKGAFYSINCAAIPSELAESELFGHAGGAFTGARGAKRGLLELAEGGSLLLNEIGDLPLSLQAKLLTFLDTRTFTRVGGQKSVTVNARLIAATNSDLTENVKAGRFRADLFFRLNVFPIRVPPLRERVGDLPILVQDILKELARAVQLPTVPVISPEQMERLALYSWPGNVRELRNVLERAVILSRGDKLRFDHLGSVTPEVDEWLLNVPFPTDRSLDDVVREVKCSLMEEALRRAGGQKQRAATLLGVSRYTLTRQLEKLGCPGKVSR